MKCGFVCQAMSTRIIRAQVTNLIALALSQRYSPGERKSNENVLPFPGLDSSRIVLEC